jgi:hypothetical protein
MFIALRHAALCIQERCVTSGPYIWHTGCLKPEQGIM